MLPSPAHWRTDRDLRAARLVLLPKGADAMRDHEVLGFESVGAMLDAACAVPAQLSDAQVDAILSTGDPGGPRRRTSSAQAPGCPRPGMPVSRPAHRPCGRWRP